MNALRKVFALLEEWLGAILLLVICGITLVNVFSRYLFNQPFSWAEELSTILFVWLVMVGAALALKKRQHFAVTLLLERCDRRGNRVARRTANALALAASLLLLFYGIFYAGWGIETVTPSMGISRVWLYAAIPAGALLLSIRAFQQCLSDWRPSSSGNSKEIEK